MRVIVYSLGEGFWSEPKIEFYSDRKYSSSAVEKAFEIAKQKVIRSNDRRSYCFLADSESKEIKDVFHFPSDNPNDNGEYQVERISNVKTNKRR